MNISYFKTMTTSLLLTTLAASAYDASKSSKQAEMSLPASLPTYQPTNTASLPNYEPTNTASKPDPPTTPSDELCFTVSTYDSIDSDIATLKNDIGDEKTRSHFLGGILRLASHDFMDFDPNNNSPMGPDGCFDEDHPINDGLSKHIWCPTCNLRLLYERTYPHVSRADFWIAAAHAVIRQTSVGNALDLKDTFLWGRKDMDSCQGSGERLPTTAGCDQTEEVFLRKMGLEWKDAVALMGGHTLGGGSIEHQGTWVDTNQKAQVFDKGYYDQIFNKAWWPRNDEHPAKDWVTTRGSSVEGLMLNTDMCLAFDIERVTAGESPCCTEINDECTGPESRKRKCPMAHLHDSREAVEEMLGRGSHPDPNAPFYNAFTEAWRKATTVGQENLSPLVESCGSLFA